MKKNKNKLSLLIAVLVLFGTVIPYIPAKATVTTSESDNSNELREVYSECGHLQFNVAAGSNVNSKGNREYSHVSAMKQYEKNHSSKLQGNSSGGYLDGSKNEGGTIQKAYLIIETSTIDYSLPDYPITFVSGTTGRTITSKPEVYFFDKTYSSGNERRSGMIDVTNFVKENGYGWYYCCNIPYCIDGSDWGSDQFAGWKLIVIEENYNVPMRILKLKLGAQNIMGEGESSEITISGEGIRTTRTEDVTGQFLFGMAGADPGPVQANSIQYAYGNVNNPHELSDWKTFKTTSGVRTPENPLVFISSRNGVPLDSETSFENPVYFKGGNYSSTNENGSYQAGAGDLELLDITTTSDYYHDVKIDKDQLMVGFRFETVTNCALMTTVLGLAIDIDVPSYDNKCDVTYDNETNTFKIEGTLENVTPLYDVGISVPEFVFEYDPDLTVASYTARITSLVEDDSAKYERVLNKNEIQFDKENHKLTFQIEGITNGNTKAKINTKTDTLFYTIILTVDKVKDYYDNITYVNGSLVSSGTDTNLYLTKIAASNLRNSLSGIVTRKNLAGKITWNDNNDEEHYRPREIEVSLCMDSVAIDTMKVTGNGNIWEYSFDDLSVYKTLDYQFDYEALIKEEYEHYTPSYDGNNIIMNLKQRYIPTNKAIPQSVSLLNNAITDMTPFGLNIGVLSEAYGITDDMNYSYMEKIVNSDN